MQVLENKLSQIAGVKIEITIRGEQAFTFSFEGQNVSAENAIKKYFNNSTPDPLSGYDQECELTVLFYNS